MVRDFFSGDPTEVTMVQTTDHRLRKNGSEIWTLDRSGHWEVLYSSASSTDGSPVDAIE
jgi:hypothetical protein